MLAGQYDEFLQMSTADVQKGLPVAELAKVGALIKTYGAMEKIGDVKSPNPAPTDRGLSRQIRHPEHQFSR